MFINVFVLYGKMILLCKLKVKLELGEFIMEKFIVGYEII